MRLFIIFLLILNTQVLAQDRPHYSKFYETKIHIKDEIVKTIQTYAKPEMSHELQTKITDELKKSLNRLILDRGDKFVYQLISDYEDNKSMFFTVVIQYEDEYDSIVWEFHALCNKESILFLSRNAETPPSDYNDYYNWLTLEKG